MLFNGPDNPEIAPTCRGSTSNTRFFWPTRVWAPIGISISSAVFARLVNVTSRQTDTDRPRYSVCSKRPHLTISAMWPNNNTRNADDTVYGAVFYNNSHCQSSHGSLDECRLNARRPPTVRPCQQRWAASPSVKAATICIRIYYYYSYCLHSWFATIGTLQSLCGGW